ncbi:MAG TPA: glutathione S-transferase family protein [Micropepsaceae bacterium]|jgi:glutathione S-transferase|nr:glutathione S-transferase family protein [Micropepsaceae bacterium]
MVMKIYGAEMSRASRVLWCARELGVPFEHVDVPWENQKTAEFLAVNPCGKFPGFVDGDLKLFESLAINLYIAKKYGTGELYPTNVEDEGRTFQWTLWAATEVEPHALPSLMVQLGYSKDVEGAAAAAEKLKPALKILDDCLKDREYLVGKKFSVADLNVAAVASLTRHGKIDISYAPHVVAWLDKCLARPARNPKQA